MAPSILWYDLETFGLEPRYDRIAQFAALRTDESLETIGEKILLYCKPTPTTFPAPFPASSTGSRRSTPPRPGSPTTSSRRPCAPR